jgi:hypothetical protein
MKELEEVTLRGTMTEIAGSYIYSIIERMSGKYPGEYDVSKWRDTYEGRKDLPPYCIEINNFRSEVDCLTDLIMLAVERKLQ